MHRKKRNLAYILKIVSLNSTPVSILNRFVLFEIRDLEITLYSVAVYSLEHIKIFRIYISMKYIFKYCPITHTDYIVLYFVFRSILKHPEKCSDLFIQFIIKCVRTFFYNFTELKEHLKNY